MKEILGELKEARISIMRARRHLELIGGREISVFELNQSDLYLEGVIFRLQILEPDPPAPVRKEARQGEEGGYIFIGGLPPEFTDES